MGCRSSSPAAISPSASSQRFNGAEGSAVITITSAAVAGVGSSRQIFTSRIVASKGTVGRSKHVEGERARGEVQMRSAAAVAPSVASAATPDAANGPLRRGCHPKRRDSFVMPMGSDGLVAPNSRTGHCGTAIAIIAAAETVGAPFEDPDFPANDSSLFHDKRKLQDAAMWMSLVWRRAADIVFNTDTVIVAGSRRLPRPATGSQRIRVLPPGPPQLFDAGISPDDVQQGALGDCYFMSALAAAAEHPAVVKGLFVNSRVSSCGAYGVRLFVNGEPVEVVVDDRFPCHPDGRPAFTRGKGRELWVLLVEKAWAKLHGSYQAIESGDTGATLSALTGVPSNLLRIRDGALPPEELWQRLLAAEGKALVCCSVDNDPGRDLFQLVGLVEEHAYAVLDVRERVLSDRPDPLKLVRLRNPWGCGEWKGEYGDKSTVWTTSEMKAAFDYKDVDEGVFWISFDDFLTFFTAISMVQLRGTFVRDCVPLAFGGTSDKIVVDVTVVEAETECIFALHQPTGPGDGALGYSNVRFEIIKIEPRAEWIVHSRMLTSGVRELSLPVTLSVGTYAVHLVGAFERTTRVVFSAVTSAPIGLKVQTISDEMARAELELALRMTTRAKGTAMSFGSEDEPGPVGCCGFTWKCEAGYCLLYENNSTRILHELVDTVSENIVIDGISESSLDIVLQPGESRFVFAHIASLKKGWNFNVSRSFFFERVYDSTCVAELRDLAITSGERMTYENVGDPFIYKYQVTYDTTGAVVVYQNESRQGNSLVESVEYELTNMEVLDMPGVAAPNFTVRVPPGATRVLVLKPVDVSQGTGFSTKLRYTLERSN